MAIRIFFYIPKSASEYDNSSLKLLQIATMFSHILFAMVNDAVDSFLEVLDMSVDMMIIILFIKPIKYPLINFFIIILIINIGHGQRNQIRDHKDIELRLAYHIVIIN